MLPPNGNNICPRSTRLIDSRSRKVRFHCEAWDRCQSPRRIRSRLRTRRFSGTWRADLCAGVGQTYVAWGEGDVQIRMRTTVVLGRAVHDGALPVLSAE